MRMRDKKRIVQMFLTGMSVDAILNDMWLQLRTKHTDPDRIDIEQAIREAFEVEKERRCGR